jgi:hypothetical protein
VAEGTAQPGAGLFVGCQFPAQQCLGQGDGSFQGAVKAGDEFVGHLDGRRQIAVASTPGRDVSLTDDVIGGEGLAEEARGEIGDETRGVFSFPALHGSAGGDAAKS